MVYRYGKTEALAYDRLVDAAPDLLSALNGMMVFYGMDEDKDNGACGATWNKARAAVAKATVRTAITDEIPNP